MSGVNMRSLRPRVGRVLDPSLQAPLVITQKEDRVNTPRLEKATVSMRRHSLRPTTERQQTNEPSRARPVRRSLAPRPTHAPLETPQRGFPVSISSSTACQTIPSMDISEQNLPFSNSRPAPISTDILNRIVEQNSIIIKMMMRQTELEQRLERVQHPSAPISTPVTPIELPQMAAISQESDIVDISHNNQSQPIERQSIKRESSVGDEDNNRKRRNLNLPSVKRNLDGSFSGHAKLLEIGRCEFPPADLNTPEASFKRKAIFQSILKRYRDHEADLARQRSRYKYRDGVDPRVSYTVHSFKNAQKPNQDFSLRAYCSSRVKHECPATAILDYNWNEQTYRFYKCFKHNHRLDGGIVKWDAILLKEEDNIPNVQVLVSKFSKGIDEIKVKDEQIE